MPTNKSVVGFDDNLAARSQEYAPTQYAIGKLRAARTPYGARGVIVNDANGILRPGLYVMELNSESLNVAGQTSGILYIYQISVDPDESIHGGHVADSIASAKMNIRQIGYFHNGTTGKVMTRVGTPLDSYTGSTVNLIEAAPNAQTTYVFVLEIGMWVKKNPVQLAVTWSEWQEFGSGSDDNPSYTFIETISNGLQLHKDANDNVSVVAYPATNTTFGVIKTIASVSMIADNSFSNYVPDVNAVDAAVKSISSYTNDVSQMAAATSYNLNAHITTHPLPRTADSQNTGIVIATDEISQINTVYAAAKYTVPTINALFKTSSSLSSYINTVSSYVDTISSIVQTHVTNGAMHGGGGPGGGGDLINTTGVISFYDAGTSKEIYLDWDSTTVNNGVRLSTNAAGKLIASARQASYDYYGTVKTITNITNDTERVPTAYAVWSALNNLSPSTGGDMRYPIYGSAGSFKYDGYTITGYNSVKSGRSGSSGTWLLISIVATTTAEGCVGVGIAGTYIPLEGVRGGATTKFVPIPPNTNWVVYNDGGTGTTVDVRIL